MMEFESFDIHHFGGWLSSPTNDAMASYLMLEKKLTAMRSS